MSPDELPIFLKKTELILGKDWLSSATSSSKDIAAYYRRLRRFYERMHSKEGAMHFPIKPLSGGSHAEGLQFHVEDLSQCILEMGCKRVVELGSGMGFNLIGLAGKHPDVQFLGLDLSGLHTKEARKRALALGLSNVEFQMVNFDALFYADLESPELVFSIEALCHSKDIGRVLQVVASGLAPQGRMVIFDGYGTDKIRQASLEQQRAADYFAKGFYLPNPQYLSDTLAAAKAAGLPDVVVRDYTSNILSNFVGFEDGVKLLFRYPRLSRTLLRAGILPMEIMRHCLAGLYGPYLLKQGLAGYFRLELCGKV